jgi:hypothetical protein
MAAGQRDQPLALHARSAVQGHGVRDRDLLVALGVQQEHRRPQVLDGGHEVVLEEETLERAFVEPELE